MPAARSLLAGKRDQKLCTAGRCQGRRAQRPGASARCPRGAERPVLRPREGGGGPGLASGVPGGPTAGVRERRAAEESASSSEDSARLPTRRARFPDIEFVEIPTLEGVRW